VVSKISSEDDSFGAVWAKSPKDAVDLLEKRNCGEALVGGGRTLAHAFLTENLLSEIQLDVEPTIYGSGIPLFGEIRAETPLELLESKRSGSHTVRMHYRVRT